MFGIRGTTSVLPDGGRSSWSCPRLQKLTAIHASDITSTAFSIFLYLAASRRHSIDPISDAAKSVSHDNHERLPRHPHIRTFAAFWPHAIYYRV